MKGRETLIGVDLEVLKRKIRDAHILVIVTTESYIRGIKDPHDVEHLALNLQIQEAAKGEKEVYLIVMRPVERKNFSLLMDMLEGSRLKSIIFVDRDDKRDWERSRRLLSILMGPARVSGTSRDAWLTE